MSSLWKSLIVLSTLLFVSAGAPAHADPFKYCAVGTGVGGSTNCGFTSLEQCRATTHSGGGFCQPNPMYTGDSGAAETKRKTVKKRTQN